MEVNEELMASLIDKGITFLVNLGIFILILFAAKILVGWVTKATNAALDRTDRVNDTLQKFLINVLGKVLWVIALIAALPKLGVEVAPLVASLGVSGFILGFAFQDSLSNLAAGVMILLNNPFKVGDFIEADGETPEDQVSKSLLREDLENVLDTLSPRERDVLRLRYGLDDGRMKTLEEIGQIFNVTRERIRQIEAKALRKLRHPNRNSILKEYIR